MISLFTPPGTKIVCIEDEVHHRYNNSCGGKYRFNGDLDGLTKNHVYTVKEIIEDERTLGGFAVVLEEITRPKSGGYSPKRFRRLDLPKSITSLLNTQDIPKELLLEDI